MKTNNLKKLTLTAIFAAIATAGSLFSFPILGAKCSPIQHLINILCAIFLGPTYGVGCAFIASFLRNILGLGTLLAFPGSMCGAALAGILYHCSGRRWTAYLGEVCGTALIGGILAYPVASLILGNTSARLFTFVMPFLVSTAGGAVIAAILCEMMAGTGLLTQLKSQLEENHGSTVIYNTDGCCKKGHPNERDTDSRRERASQP